jgi:hypothetical protein
MLLKKDRGKDGSGGKMWKKTQQILRGSTKSHSLENCLWKRLWTCHNTDYGMNVEGGGKSTYCII